MDWKRWFTAASFTCCGVNCTLCVPTTAAAGCPCCPCCPCCTVTEGLNPLHVGWLFEGCFLPKPNVGVFALRGPARPHPRSPATLAGEKREEVAKVEVGAAVNAFLPNGAVFFAVLLAGAVVLLPNWNAEVEAVVWPPVHPIGWEK